MMDQINRVRVRTGKIEAERPHILRPEAYQDVTFEGFGDQADAFHEWLKAQRANLALLQYGFSFRKSEVTREPRP